MPALRLGYVALADCGPIVMAHELGLFTKHGVRVALSRELGWAAVRDKIVRGELDAAQAVVGMPFATTLGLGMRACECVTGLVLNLQGNAITLSNELWRRGVRDAASLREVSARFRGARTLTFGVVSNVSSHHFLLRRWLQAAGINPDHDVRLAVVPPSQMPDSLRAGNLDGFCAGEPWNSVAVAARVGWIAALSTDLAPGHPEKVLMVRRDFAEQHAHEHQALIAALLEACAFSQVTENREQVMAVLARPAYMNRPAESLRPSFTGVFDAGQERTLRAPNFLVFAGDDANEPSADKAAWALNELRATGVIRQPVANAAQLIRSVFRADIYERASKLLSKSETHEHAQPEILPCH